MKCDSGGTARRGWLSSISRTSVVPERGHPITKNGRDMSRGAPSDRSPLPPRRGCQDWPVPMPAMSVVVVDLCGDLGDTLRSLCAEGSSDLVEVVLVTPDPDGARIR